MPSGATLQQVNVRIDAELKQSAEKVLALMESSATELIRCAYQKVARGAEDWAQAMEVLKEPAAAAPEDGFEEGWRAAEEFYRSIGYDPSAQPLDSRPWNEVREEGLAAHFAEKGTLA